MGRSREGGSPPNGDEVGVIRLRLYVAGHTPRSIAAFRNLRRICADVLGNDDALEVIDLLREPKLARGQRILALPTLVRLVPEPTTQVVGDLSDRRRVLVGLGLAEENPPPASDADPDRSEAEPDGLAVPGGRGERGDERYQLRLYVAGTSPRAIAAIQQARSVCDEQLEGRYELEVIDVYQQPGLARADQVVAVPALIKRLPPPLRVMTGTIASSDELLVGLDLYPPGG